MKKTNTSQLAFFHRDILQEKKENGKAEWGTFKDSLRAPIHGWFTYPAGFSYKSVESSLKKYGIKEADTVYDPFMGTGTTNVVSKKLGVNSFGVEAHPFVFRIARTKLNWTVRGDEVLEALETITNEVKNLRKKRPGSLKKYLGDNFPELVLKCYEEETLYDLMSIRDKVLSGQFSRPVVDFLFVALTGLLREISSAHTGWPYIAPNKKKSSSIGKNAIVEFPRLVMKMLGDIQVTVRQANPRYKMSIHKIFNADSRDARKLIPDKCVDHVFTSPPYLNNFDYADRTRLELYFFGEAKTWGDITKTIRSRLITSATTQILRNDPRYKLSEELQRYVPEVFDYLKHAVAQLSDLRMTKGGKKSYDHLVAGYFNDMYRILKDTFRVMKPGKTAIFVLGDSAPYGVHIPTDEFIGKIGVGIGFRQYEQEILRTRGGKWKMNPQRHSVALRESIVTLTK